MKKLLFLFLFSFLAIVKAQNTVTHQMNDDGYVNVPLQFNFPFYGQSFNNSWMYDNGVVSFIDPSLPGALSPWQWNAQPLNAVSGTYFIAVLWADLAPVSGVTSYTTQGNNQFQQYNWNNIAEYYSINGGTGLRLNNFSVKIEPSGKITSTYTGVNLQTSSVAVGTVGGPGEYNQISYQPAGTILNSIPNWSVDSTGVNPCISNPLISQACPGYAEAFFLQQCTINPLYNVECPGYAEAYATKMALENSNKVTETTKTETALVSDPVVNQTITTTTTTTTPTNPAAAVNLTSTPQAVQNANTQTSTETKNQTTKTETAPSGTKNTTTNTRQNTNTTQAKEQVNNATTMEQQVAAQTNVIGAMSFVPGFDAYQSAKIIDVNALALQRQYGKDVVDNRRLGRGLFGPSDSVHQEMVNQQYR